MTRTEFFDLFMQWKYQVECSSRQDHDGFISAFLQTTGLDLKENGHWAGYSINYPYLCWSRDGDHICGTGVNYPYSDLITYETYLRMVEPDAEPNSVSLEEVL